MSARVSPAALPRVTLRRSEIGRLTVARLGRHDLQPDPLDQFVPETEHEEFHGR